MNQSYKYFKTYKNISKYFFIRWYAIRNQKMHFEINFNIRGTFVYISVKKVVLMEYLINMYHQINCEKGIKIASTIPIIFAV